jgi:phosphoribosylanthranilate isomerase
MVRVKICGMTRAEDAVLAVRLGVHALGFIFAPSPRRISPEAVRDIVRGLSPLVQTVGVFVNEDPARIREIVSLCGLDLVQLHGDESPAECEALMPRTVKAFRLKDEASLAGIEPIPRRSAEGPGRPWTGTWPPGGRSWESRSSSPEGSRRET